MPSTQHPQNSISRPQKKFPKWIVYGLLTFFGFLAAVVLSAGLAMILVYPRLPSMNALLDYHPKLPLRIYTAEGILIGEFGEERRQLIHIKEIPKYVPQAILAIEDDRFYEHGGVDYIGIVRALLHNLTQDTRQGASTITQQLARNFFLSSEQSYLRKLYEAVLALKIEQNLTKLQILEIYMNQIYLGQRAYGFEAAAQAYFGKSLREVSIAEAAMLAGLPKAPSAYNPIINPKRAQIRQRYILQRMHELGYITQAQYNSAINEQLIFKKRNTPFGAHAEFVAEIARQIVQDEFKEDIYSQGLNVHTSIRLEDQKAAYAALRRGVLSYDQRKGYRGPEGFVELPTSAEEAESIIEKTLAERPDADEIIAAIALEASPEKIVAVLANGQKIILRNDDLKWASSWLKNPPNNKKIQRGSIIRVVETEANHWRIAQLPEVESAFVSVNTHDGSIRALVGGFDFDHQKFNHVTQAWRQPGSSFKPFIYSAALERGFSPATIVNDAPLFFPGTETGGQAWAPKNYDNQYEGPMTLRHGLAKSKNMISIRVLHKIGPKYAQEYVTRFGFDPNKHPPYLTLALGAGSVTPLQLATAYATFANGGYKINPYLITKITDQKGNVLAQAKPIYANDETHRVLDERNAFVMDSLLKDVVRHGTAMRALSLKRNDIAGKTGTTNDSMDAWFAGYHPQVAAVSWIGFDQPRNLGNRETGGGLALPIWIDYMKVVLPNLPITERPVPEGITQANGDYYYTENVSGGIEAIDDKKEITDATSSEANTVENTPTKPDLKEAPNSQNNAPKEPLH